MGTFPDWLEPMAATLTQERFATPEWVFERKFDGIRLLAYKRGGEVRLYSRNRLPQNLPTVAEAIARLPHPQLILDGEAIWSPDEGGYHVFDILWIDGRDLTALPLTERRDILQSLPLTKPLRRVVALEDPEPWERARAEGWEGVIAKRRDSPYEHRRSKHWLKMKCEIEQDLVVGGFTDPQGTRVGFGALLVGYWAKGGADSARGGEDDFVFAGRVGTGFDTKMLIELRSKLGAGEIPESPFTKGTDLPRIRAHWTTPEVVVQVAFIEWTESGKLRHPRLLGIRAGRNAREVIREP